MPPLPRVLLVERKKAQMEKGEGRGLLVARLPAGDFPRDFSGVPVYGECVQICVCVCVASLPKILRDCRVALPA